VRESRERAAAFTPRKGRETLVTVAASPDEQNDPHLDGDIVSFTESGILTSRVRYFGFSTLTTATVPAPAGDVDLLSDVAGRRIALFRVTTDSVSPTSFDTSTLTSTEIVSASTDADFDPNVLPDGNVIVWQRTGAGLEGILKSLRTLRTTRRLPTRTG
jgi:hypothetical protein